MTITQTIQRAIEGGYVLPADCLCCGKEEKYCRCGNEAHLLNPLFWQALGKSLGWGGEIYKTETGEEYGKRICLHCGVDCTIQPPRGSGCSHVHYPEACDTCSKKAMTWRFWAKNLFEHLMEGKDIESYFQQF